MAPRPVPTPFTDTSSPGDEALDFHDARETSTPPRGSSTAAASSASAANSFADTARTDSPVRAAGGFLGGAVAGTGNNNSNGFVTGRSPNRRTAAANHRSRRNQRSGLSNSGNGSSLQQSSSAAANNTTAAAPPATGFNPTFNATANPSPSNANAASSTFSPPRAVLVQAQRLRQMKAAKAQQAHAARQARLAARGGGANANAGRTGTDAGGGTYPVQQQRVAQEERQQQAQVRQDRVQQQQHANVDLRSLLESLDLSGGGTAGSAPSSDATESLIDSLVSALPAALNLGDEEADGQMYREVAEAMVRCRIRKRKASPASATTAPTAAAAAVTGGSSAVCGPTAKEDGMRRQDNDDDDDAMLSINSDLDLDLDLDSNDSGASEVDGGGNDGDGTGNDDNDYDDNNNIAFCPTDEGMMQEEGSGEWVEVSPTTAAKNGGGSGNDADEDDDEQLDRSIDGLGGGFDQDGSALDPSIPSDEEGGGGGSRRLFRDGGKGRSSDSSKAKASRSVEDARKAVDRFGRMRLDDDDDDDDYEGAASGGVGPSTSSFSDGAAVSDRFRSLDLGGPKEDATDDDILDLDSHLDRDSSSSSAAQPSRSHQSSVSQSLKFTSNPPTHKTTASPAAAASAAAPRHSSMPDPTTNSFPASAASVSGASSRTTSTNTTATPASTSASASGPGPTIGVSGRDIKSLRQRWEDFASPTGGPTGTGTGAVGAASAAVGGAVDVDVDNDEDDLEDDILFEEEDEEAIMRGGTAATEEDRTDQRQRVAAASAADTSRTSEAGSATSDDNNNNLDVTMDAEEQVRREIFEGNLEGTPSSSSPSSSGAATAEVRGGDSSGAAASSMKSGGAEAETPPAAAAAAAAAAAYAGTDDHGFPSPSNFPSPPGTPEIGDGLDSSFLFSPPENVHAAAAASAAATSASVGGASATEEKDVADEAAAPTTTMAGAAASMPRPFAVTPPKSATQQQQTPQEKPAPHTNAKQGKMRRKVVGSATAGMFAAAPRQPDPPGLAAPSAGSGPDAAPEPAAAAAAAAAASSMPAAAPAPATEQPSLFKVDLSKNKDGGNRSTRRGQGGKGAGSSRGIRGSIRNINPGGLNVNASGGFGAGGGGIGPAATPTDSSRAPGFADSRPTLSPMDVEDASPPKDDYGLSAAAARVAAEAAAANIDVSVRGSFSIGSGDNGGTHKPSSPRKGSKSKLRQMRQANRAKAPTTPLAASDGWGTSTDHDGERLNQPFFDPYATQRQQQQQPTQPVTESHTTTVNSAEGEEDLTGRDSHVAALRDEGRELYIQARYTESIVRYTYAIRAQTRNFTTTRLNADGTSDDELLALLYGNRGAALMMVGGFDAAASDCQKALGNVPDEFGHGLRPEAVSIQSWNLRPESGPALRSKLLCRMGRALLKAGKIDRSEEAFDGAIRTAEASLSKYGRANLTQEATSVLDQSIADATLNKRDIKRSRDATAGILKCCGGLPPNVAVSGKKNGAEVLLYVNAALSTSPGDMDLHTQKIRLLASMKCWADLASHAEHLAADCVRFDGVFVEDLEPLHPFPGAPPAKNLTADFFETNQDEDRAGTTGPRILDAKAVSDAVLRLPLAVLPLYLRALRLEERYTEASRATSALDAHTRDTSTLTTRNLAWLGKEKGKLRRTTTMKESGDALFRSGDYAGAAAKYASCLLIDGEGIDAAPMGNDGSNAGGRLHAVLHCNRAACYMALKHYREAVKECTSALLIHSTYMKAMLRRARCYARLDRHEEATSEYERWINLVETAKRLPRPSTADDSTCYFDRPMDTTPEDLTKARKELSDVGKAKVAKAEADANAKARAERQQWYENNFRTNSAGSGAGANDAYRRRQQWYDQNPDNGGEGARRWDSFNGSSPKKPGARSNSYTGGRSYGAGQGGYQQRSRSHSRPRQPMGTPGSNLTRTHYEVLEVSPTCTTAEIKKAYRKMALKYHPDKNKDPGAADVFRRVQSAYDTLSDEIGRRKYDAEMRLRRFGNI